MLPTRLLLHANRSQSIGFIGLGAMGRGMAANVVNKAFQQHVTDPKKPLPAFVVYDAHQPAVDNFLNEHTRQHSGRDVIPASSPAGVAKLASTIITVLPSSPHVQQVYLGENGILEALKELDESKRQETLLIDSTTLDQAIAKEVAKDMTNVGAAMLDAPVSGGVMGAQAGTLSFMVGGPDEAFRRAEKFFNMMGKRAIHCGGSGNGLVAKICNNLLLGIEMAGTAEAMLLGQSLGLAPDLLASVINTSTGRCWASEVNNPAPGALPSVKPPADRDYQGGFLTKLMTKDLNLAIAAAKTTDTPLPLGGLTTTLYNALTKREEFSDRDFSVIFEYFKIAQQGGLKKTELPKQTEIK
ncbi:hypothetical protein OIO90_002858 [Microbotryomycetes sp. JL221]|nr:hypothetical protein OIO90_002858 [Microbotryomycetes sp. JL221]